jgi:hypothetical protein
MANDQVIDERPEGVYCKWEEYPQGLGRLNIFTIERVNGDASVSTFSCTREESAVIHSFLGQA